MVLTFGCATFQMKAVHLKLQLQNDSIWYRKWAVFSYFLLNWKNTLLLPCIMEEDFIRNRASNQRHLKSSSFWMAVVFNKRTLWGGWLVLMSYLICCIRALSPRDCPPLSPPFACSATPARSSHHFPPKQNLIVFYPVSLLSNSFYSFRSGSTD